MWLDYRYKLGLKVGDTRIPDPKTWSYQVGDLDTSGKRDATGRLHRARVAQKINYEFEWEALEWEMLQTILNATKGEIFIFTGPDPRTFDAMYSLKLKFIEY